MKTNGTYLSVRVENILRGFASTTNEDNWDKRLCEVTEGLCELFYDELEYKYKLRGRPKEST